MNEKTELYFARIIERARLERLAKKNYSSMETNMEYRLIDSPEQGSGKEPVASYYRKKKELN